MVKRILVVQARMGSRRLPGKVLAKIGDRTVLEWVIIRARQAQLGPLLVTTSLEPGDDAIVRLCKARGVTCFRGKEHDVLDRYHTAMTVQAALSVVRVTADCPLLCPELLIKTVRLFDARHADYAAVQGAPTGLGQEVISHHALTEAWRHARSPHDREHVVTYTLDRPVLYPAAYVKAPPYLQAYRDLDLSIDTPDDLRLLRRLYRDTDGMLFRLNSRQILETVERDRECLKLPVP